MRTREEDLLFLPDFVASLVLSNIFPGLPHFCVLLLTTSPNPQDSLPHFTTRRSGIPKERTETITRLLRTRAGRLYGTQDIPSQQWSATPSSSCAFDPTVPTVHILPVPRPEADLEHTVAASAEQASPSSSAGRSPTVSSSRPRRKSRLRAISTRRSICGKCGCDIRIT